VSVGVKVSKKYLDAGECQRDERKQTFRLRVVKPVPVVKTRGVSSLWDKSAENLIIGRTATGVEGA